MLETIINYTANTAIVIFILWLSISTIYLMFKPPKNEEETDY